MTVTTKDRLLSEGMHLFGEQGYAIVTVAQIESAAGLAPGSGALYKHFPSKQALLEAGIDRQLDRRRAMRDIRAMFAGLGDLRAELTVMGRYLLNVIDAELELLRIGSRVPASLQSKLDNTHAALFDGLYTEFTEWVASWAPGASSQAAHAVSAIGVDSLLGRRTTNGLFKVSGVRVDDEQYVDTWATVLIAHIDSLRNPS